MTPGSRPTWNDARQLLGRFDGAASEIFVIDLPASSWPRVVERIARIPRLRVCIDGREALAEPRPFDAAWLARMLSPPAGDAWYGLQSDAEDLGGLQVHAWPVAPAEPLDLELVFWSDRAFPPRLSTAERARRWDGLLDIAEDCRRGAPGARCILAAEHNGDPRELLRSATLAAAATAGSGRRHHGRVTEIECA